MNIDLIRKYNVPGPRYTSYPTVPYWDETPPTAAQWNDAVRTQFAATNSDSGISLYIHLPYCESLCTYCGCNTRITVNHAVERPYIDALLMEWQLYLNLLDERPVISELHLGGGTPTFFSPENLRYLINGLVREADVAPNAEFGFEGHPNNTTKAHLATLADLGFTRLSLGIQDFDPKVQEIVNRIQPVEAVERVTSEARELGYTSINFDLIYGLPFQTAESVRNTVAEVVRMRPDRIAFYSYAHVPWIKPGQRRFTEADLPADEVKRNLYELGKQLFEESGYREIGMDHFALPEDSLSTAMDAGTLHRNFMGYTPAASGMMIGLGASSISDAWGAFVQNRKKVEDYIAEVHEGRIPFFRGHMLTREDACIRRHILNLMCRFETSWQHGDLGACLDLRLRDRLQEMEEDGLLEFAENALRITEKGQPFVRNVCMAFDARLWRKQPDRELFSSTV